MISHFKIKGVDTTQIDILAVYPSHPIGIIQFVHGMCDHKQRYLEMMTYFFNLGYVCIGFDHIGHGQTALNDDELGYFGHQGSDKLVENTRIVSEYIHSIYPHLPLYLFGHSMGSLIARVYLKKYPHLLSGLIVCGSPSNNHLAKLAKKACTLITKIKGERHRSSLVYKLAFGAYNKKFKESQHPYRWLSKDIQVSEAFNQDKYCHYTFTLNGYYYLFDLVEQTYSTEGWSKNHLDLPIYFIAGEDDPCIISTKDFKASIEFLKNIGYKNISDKLYPSLRHEIFNEKEKDQVFKDIETWLKKKAIHG